MDQATQEMLRHEDGLLRRLVAALGGLTKDGGPVFRATREGTTVLLRGRDDEVLAYTRWVLEDGPGVRMRAVGGEGRPPAFDTAVQNSIDVLTTHHTST